MRLTMCCSCLQFGLAEAKKKDKAGRKLRKERKNRSKSACSPPSALFTGSAADRCLDSCQSSAVLPRSRVPTPPRRASKRRPHHLLFPFLLLLPLLPATPCSPSCWSFWNTHAEESEKTKTPMLDRNCRCLHIAVTSWRHCIVSLTEYHSRGSKHAAFSPAASVASIHSTSAGSKRYSDFQSH